MPNQPAPGFIGCRTLHPATRSIVKKSIKNDVRRKCLKSENENEYENQKAFELFPLMLILDEQL
jgi:hypothetical protein